MELGLLYLTSRIFYLAFFISHLAFLSRISYFLSCISHFYLAFLSHISHFYLASRIFISHFYLASRIFYLAFTSRNFFLFLLSRISNVPYRLPYETVLRPSNQLDSTRLPDLQELVVRTCLFNVETFY